MRSLRKIVCLACCLTTASCAPAEEGPPSEGSGGSPESTCAADQEISVVSGQGVGAVFSPFEPGDVIVPYFGSQIGMEIDASVLLTGFEPREIESIEVYLNVEGAPIGYDSFSPLDLYCDGNESATIETPVLIDVTGHPTIKSVAQLNGREAEIEVRVAGPGGVSEARVNVIIEL